MIEKEMFLVTKPYRRLWNHLQVAIETLMKCA